MCLQSKADERSMQVCRVFELEKVARPALDRRRKRFRVVLPCRAWVRRELGPSVDIPRRQLPQIRILDDAAERPTACRLYKVGVALILQGTAVALNQMVMGDSWPRWLS